MGWLYSLIVRVLLLMKSLIQVTFNLLSQLRCENTEIGGGIQLDVIPKDAAPGCENTEIGGGIQCR